MLAEAEHGDVAYQHEFLVVGLERGLEDLIRVDPEPGEELRVGAGDPGRGLLESIAVGVLPDRDEDLAYRVLDPDEVDRFLDRRTGDRPVYQPSGEVVEAIVVCAVQLVAPAAGAASVEADWAAISAGVSTGGLSDGVRLPNPLKGEIGGRLTTRAQMRFMSAVERVSFSISSSTMLSRTSRYSTRMA
jgi:catechol 2,3-dioxygenase-like lactoylglutathione lyase family enzyme